MQAPAGRGKSDDESVPGHRRPRAGQSPAVEVAAWESPLLELELFSAEELESEDELESDELLDSSDELPPLAALFFFP